jgi:DNA-binding MarR family transcriptional regulator
MAGRLLSTAAVMFHTRMAELQGLGASDHKALDLLDRFGPLTAGELGERSGLAPASITGLVDRLAEKGLVRRIKDPRDGRRVSIELARERLAGFAHMFEDPVREMTELADEFTDEELETIARYIEGAAKRQQAATGRLGAPASRRGRT